MYVRVHVLSGMCQRRSGEYMSELRRQLLAAPDPSGTPAGQVSGFRGACPESWWVCSGLMIH
jgi:hypothetical protein